MKNFYLLVFDNTANFSKRFEARADERNVVLFRGLITVAYYSDGVRSFKLARNTCTAVWRGDLK